MAWVSPLENQVFRITKASNSQGCGIQLGLAGFYHFQFRVSEFFIKLEALKILLCLDKLSLYR